jgi:hypothetical protein
MKKITFLILNIGAAFAATAQSGLYNNGAVLKVSTGSVVTVKGNLTNAAGSSLANDGKITVSGNITNGQVMATSGAGTLSFAGTAAQSLNGTAAYLANNVEVNNAAGVTLNTGLKAAGSVSFISGMLTAATAPNALVFSSSASVSGVNPPVNTGHVNGYVVKEGTGSFVFPVGDAARYEPVTVNLTANGSGMQARYVVADAGAGPFTTTGASATPLLYYNKLEYWDLVPLTGATGTVTLSWDGYNNTGIGNPVNIRAAHRTGGNWLNEGGTGSGTSAAGSVTSASLSTWSPFTLGSISAASPLPVTLVSFTGVRNKSINQLYWESASETGTAEYNVERSTDLRNFTTIQTVPALFPAGHKYHYDDPFTAPGNMYYRLKMTDADGKFTYSNMVRLSPQGVNAAITVYPNPAAAYINIYVNDLSLLKSQAVITDAAGRRVQVIMLTGQQTGADIAVLAKGTYFIILADGSSTKLVKE